jgi:hypothetical protein
MRVEGSVTAISWIPSAAIEGMPKLPFEMGMGHYDEPPPDRLGEGDARGRSSERDLHNTATRSERPRLS